MRIYALMFIFSINFGVKNGVEAGKYCYAIGAKDDLNDRLKTAACSEISAGCHVRYNKANIVINAGCLPPAVHSKVLCSMENPIVGKFCCCRGDFCNNRSFINRCIKNASQAKPKTNLRNSTDPVEGWRNGTIRPWRPTNRPWLWTKRPWRPQLNATNLTNPYETWRPWKPTSRPWRGTRRPWRPTERPWWRTRKPWRPTNRPWWKTERPWRPNQLNMTNLTNPSEENEWKNATWRPWRPTDRPWWGTQRPWGSTDRPWWGTRRPWRPTARPWWGTQRPWRSTDRPWWGTRKPWGPTNRPWWKTRRPYFKPTLPGYMRRKIESFAYNLGENLKDLFASLKYGKYKK